MRYKTSKNLLENKNQNTENIIFNKLLERKIKQEIMIIRKVKQDMTITNINFY